MKFLIVESSPLPKTDYTKKFKLQPCGKKKYRKTRNEMKIFPGGRKRPRRLSLKIDDDDDDESVLK